MSRGKASKKLFSTQAMKMSADEIWMRDPMIQKKEEVEITCFFIALKLV